MSFACYHQGRIRSLHDGFMVKSLLQPPPRLSVVQRSICSFGKPKVLYLFQFAGLGIHLNPEVEVQGTIRLVTYHRIDIIMQMSNATVVTRSHGFRKSFLRILSHYFPILCPSQQVECQEDGQDITAQHKSIQIPWLTRNLHAPSFCS